MSKKVDLLASTLKNTNKNLKAVDRMLEEYRGLGEQQGATMDRLKTDLARTSDKLKEERMKRSIHETTRGSHYNDYDDVWSRGDHSSRVPTSPLRDYNPQSTDDLRSGAPRSRRASVRFFDDMDTDDHIHVLHRSLRDLSSNQQRLERDFNRELSARDKDDYDVKKSLHDLTETTKSSQIENAISTVDKRLQSIQDELKAERNTFRKKQEDVTRLSSDLQSALHHQTATTTHPTPEEIEMKTRLLRSESQKNQDLYDSRVNEAETRVAYAEAHRQQVEAELEKLNQRLDKADGSRDALLGQIEEYRKQLSSADQDKQKLLLLLDQQDEEMKNKQRLKMLEEHDHTQLLNENRRMAEELRELRTHLSKSAAVVGDYGGLQRDLDASEKQRVQLSDHIQILNKDLDTREKQAAKMVTQLQDTMDKYEALEQSRHSTLLQLEDTLKKLQATTQEAETLQTDLTSVQTQLNESESKREDIKIRAQETVKQWKLKCRRLEREVDRFTHSSQQMSERNEQLIRDMENIKTQMNINNQHVEHAKQELSDAMALRATQEEQLRTKALEVSDLKDTKDVNERHITEQRSQIEKLEFELQLSIDKYSKLFDEKVAVEDQVFGIQQQGVMLQNQIVQMQKELKEVSVEKVDLASRLADAANERQNYKHALHESQKRDEESRSEIEALMIRLREEKDYYHSRVDAMKNESEESKMKDIQSMKEMTHRFKKEHAEYEAELQALKIELHEHRTNAKQARKYKEKHQEEIDRLHHELVISKEEAAEIQKKYHEIKEELFSKSQLGADGISRARELDEELIRVKEEMKKGQQEQQDVVDCITLEINELIDTAADSGLSIDYSFSKSLSASMDIIKWSSDVKDKISWLRNELLNKQQEVKEVRDENDYDRKLYISELNNHHNIMSHVSQFRKELEEKDYQTSEKVDNLQEQVGLLTESLVAERDTILTQNQPTTQEPNSGLDTQSIRTERQRINERYARLQETVNSLRKELNETTLRSTSNLNNSNKKGLTSSLKHKDSPSPSRGLNRRVHIVTSPDLDDSGPLEAGDLHRPETPPLDYKTFMPKKTKTPPPLSMDDEEFRQKFMLET